MTNNTRRFPTILLTIAAMLPGCGSQSKPTSPPETPSQPAEHPQSVKLVSPLPNTTRVSLADAKPDAVMSALEWADRAKADNNFVISKYAGKILELSGVVADVFSTSLALKAAAEVKDITRDLVACEMQDKDFWKKVFVGQTVRLRVIAPKSDFDAIHFKWDIIGVMGPKPPTITADDWAKEFNDDETAAAKKYVGRPIILTGEIEKVKPNGAGVGSVDLKTKNGRPLECRFPPGSEVLLKSLIPGHKVSLLLKFNTVGIWDCRLLD